MPRRFEDIPREFQVEVDSRPRRRAEFTRRKFLERGSRIVGGTAVALAAEKVATYDIWPSSPMRLYSIPSRTSSRSSHGWFVPPGYGSIHGKIMAHEVERNKGVSKSDPIGALIYGNSIVKPEDIEGLGCRFADRNRLTTMSYYAPSLGTRIAMLAILANKRPVRRFIANGGPFFEDDAFMGGGAKFATAATKATGYQGGVVTKFIATAWKRFSEHDTNGVDDFFNNFEVAGRETVTGAAPDCMDSQLFLLDAPPPDWRDYRNIFIPGFSKFLFVMSQHPEDDRTVKDVQSADHWEEYFCNPLGIGMQRLYLPLPKDSDEAHANTPYAMAYTPEFITTGIVSDDHPAP